MIVRIAASANREMAVEAVVGELVSAAPSN
jgi:hypothetical protein